LPASTNEHGHSAIDLVTHKMECRAQFIEPVDRASVSVQHD